MLCDRQNGRAGHTEHPFDFVTLKVQGDRRDGYSEHPFGPWSQKLRVNLWRGGLYIGGEREESTTCSVVTENRRLQSSWREGVSWVLAKKRTTAS